MVVYSDPTGQLARGTLPVDGTLNRQAVTDGRRRSSLSVQVLFEIVAEFIMDLLFDELPRRLRRRRRRRRLRLRRRRRSSGIAGLPNR
jgi:hypothetical protein